MNVTLRALPGVSALMDHTSRNVPGRVAVKRTSAVLVAPGCRVVPSAMSLTKVNPFRPGPFDRVMVSGVPPVLANRTLTMAERPTVTERNHVGVKGECRPVHYATQGDRDRHGDFAITFGDAITEAPQNKGHGAPARSEDGHRDGNGGTTSGRNRDRSTGQAGGSGTIHPVYANSPG